MHGRRPLPRRSSCSARSTGARARRRADHRERDEGPCGLARRPRRPQRARGAEGRLGDARRWARDRRDDDLQPADRERGDPGAADRRGGLRADRRRPGPEPRHDRRQRLRQRPDEPPAAADGRARRGDDDRRPGRPAYRRRGGLLPGRLHDRGRPGRAAAEDHDPGRRARRLRLGHDRARRHLHGLRRGLARRRPTHRDRLRRRGAPPGNGRGGAARRRLQRRGGQGGVCGPRRDARPPGRRARPGRVPSASGRDRRGASDRHRRRESRELMAATIETSRRITVEVNGVLYEREVEARRLLIHFIRDDLELTGSHIGCDTGNCGACSVLLDGSLVKSCMLLAVQADGARVADRRGLASETAS